MRDESRDVGIIWGESRPDNCTCHISPPCRACVEDRSYIDDTCKNEDITSDFERYVPYSELAHLENKLKRLFPFNEGALIDCIKRIVNTQKDISYAFDVFEDLSSDDLLKYQRKVCNALRNDFCRIFGEDTIDNIEKSFKKENVKDE
jgi:hypothetical protein